MYNEIFRALPHCCMILNVDSPYFTVLDISDFFLEKLKFERSKYIGNSIIDIINSSENSDDSMKTTLRESLLSVYKTKIENTINVVPYNINNKKLYWSITNTPVLNKGKLNYIINTAIDITQIINYKNKTK